MSLPAILGGSPAFDPPLPFAQPTIEEPKAILRMVTDSLDSGMVTNGPLVEELEERVAESFRVAHCVAVASCTTGLMLVVQALAGDGPAVVPSFTFSASAHALAWNGLAPVFVDCDSDTWCVRPQDIPENADLVMAVHVSGVPCDVEGLQRRADEIGATLIFDSAHGAGSLVGGEGGGRRPLGGFGQAEVFSLTPTKVMSGAEGGLVTTNDPDLAARIRLGRDYGNPGDYDTRTIGLNGRLSELHAAMALASLEHLEGRVEHRNALAARYRALLGQIPGVGFQVVGEGNRSSYKDFTILVDPAGFGVGRDAVVAALHAEGVPTRPYYSPPVHLQAAYAHLPKRQLPVTERLASRVVSLPIWSHMSQDTVVLVCDAVTHIQAHAEAISDRLASTA